MAFPTIAPPWVGDLGSSLLHPHVVYVPDRETGQHSRINTILSLSYLHMAVTAPLRLSLPTIQQNQDPSSPLEP